MKFLTEKFLSVQGLQDTVFSTILCALALAAIWFAVKALARRRSGRARILFTRVDPWAQALSAWVRSAPATFTYIAAWSVTSVLMQSQPEGLADILARINSTNLASLAIAPARALFTSAFLVADYGAGFLLYVVVYSLISVRLEQRLGSARWLVVAMCSHVFGSLLTVTVERVGIAAGVIPKGIAFTQDVGVSFVMVGTCGAYLWLVGPKWRVPYCLAMVVGIILPMLVSRSIWDLGHFFATCVGAGVGYLAVRHPLREPILWRELVRVPPRSLPTFDAKRRP